MSTDKNNSRKDGNTDEYQRFEFDSIVQTGSVLPKSTSFQEEQSSYEKLDTWQNEFIELLVPVLVAGFGNVLTGYLLSYSTTKMTVYRYWPQLVIVVPALLGLKGNVEMTLASRLSTYANLSNFQDRKHFFSFFISNFYLVLCQGITIGLVASMVTLSFASMDSQSFNIETVANQTLNLIPHKISYLHYCTIMISASIFTVCLATLILSLLIFVLVCVCVKYKRNPDNVAIPLAASVGDFVTLLIYVTCCGMFFNSFAFNESQHSVYILSIIWILIAIILLVLLPMFGLFASKSDHTSHLVYHGWYSILSGMALQTLGGFIMENTLQVYPLVPLFQPILNGIGGNLVAIQCTRMSTFLHKYVAKCKLPNERSSLFPSPFTLLNPSKFAHARLIRLLIVLSVVCHLCFLYVIHLIPNNFHLSTHFVVAFLVTELVQLLFLIYITNALVHFQWLAGIDPDNNSIPFMTALADFFGSALLGLLFMYMAFVRRID